MATSFQWLPEFELGVPSLDSQHRMLLTFAGELNEAIASGEADRIEPAMGALVEFTRKHFRSEESIMQATGYSGYDLHKAAHEKLMEQIEIVRGDLMTGRIHASQILRLFVEVWVSHHIGQEDRELAEHLALVGQA